MSPWSGSKEPGAGKSKSNGSSPSRVTLYSNVVRSSCRELRRSRRGPKFKESNTSEGEPSLFRPEAGAEDSDCKRDLGKMEDPALM